jgi:tetratricopeptide (TPR) repeat protein
MSRRSKGSNQEGAPRAGHAADAALRHAQASYQAGRLAEAAALCQKVLSHYPHHFDALHMRAILQFQLGCTAESLLLVERALSSNPRSEHALNSHGLILQALGRHAEALASYDRALMLRPQFADALYNRGNALHDLKRHGEAVLSYERALALRPDYAEALYNRGLVLQELARYQEALDSYGHAVALRPDLADAHYNRGLILHELKRYDEALTSYERALALRSDFSEALNNRGNTLRCLNRYDEALESLGQALRLRPDYVEAFVNSGLVLQDLGRCDEALESFSQALVHRPDSAEAHCGASLCRLSRGDFIAGWEEYEWRWRNPKAEAVRPFLEPLWLGTEELAGRTILLWAEQGFGDTLQFCRYAKYVADAGGAVVLEVQPALKSLLSCLEGTTRVIAHGEALPAFDCHCPLLSLPLAFKTTLTSIPGGVPYLTSDIRQMRAWQDGLAGMKRPRIGLAWSGDPRHPNDRNRSMRLSDLQPLFAVDAAYIAVQKDMHEADMRLLAACPDIRHFGNQLQDFADTAAIISCLDLVITVDTSIAHLAGAMGKPVWVLLSSNPDWRWMQGREDSPWYPTARLFRQSDPGDWRGVVEHVKMSLSALVESQRQTAD